MDAKTAMEMEAQYSHDDSKGCFSYYFVHDGTQWCIDATEETEYMGRLINHSRKNPNLLTKVVEVDHLPHLTLIAKRDLIDGEELLYDYGDKSKKSLKHNPWLNS